MNLNLIQNIVFAILFAYFIIVVFKSVVRLVQVLVEKLFVYFRLKKINKEVDQEYIDYLRSKIMLSKLLLAVSLAVAPVVSVSAQVENTFDTFKLLINIYKIFDI